MSKNLTNVRHNRWSTQTQLLRIATRNVMRNRRRSLLTLFAIGFSIAVVVSVNGVLNGLQATIKEKVLLGQTGLLQVHKKGFADNVSRSPLSFGIEDAAALVATIEKVPGVVAATARINFFTMANANDTTIFTLAFAVDPINELRTCPRKQDEWGSLRVSGDKGLVSPEVSRQLAASGAQPQDKLGASTDVTLLAPDLEGVLNAANLSVAGVLDNNPAFSGEKKLVYLPLAQAQDLLRMPGQAVEIAVRGDDFDHPEALAAAVQRAVGPGYEVQTWKQLAKFVVDILGMQNAALGFVIAIFIAVLLIGIVNTMLMSVLERTREIGTMMAVGVRRSQIIELFIVESTLLGALGAAVGAGLGLVAVAVMHHIGIPLRPPGTLKPEAVRPFVSMHFVLVTMGLSMLGGAAAAIYPARRASKLSPVDALGAV